MKSLMLSLVLVGSLGSMTSFAQAKKAAPAKEAEYKVDAASSKVVWVGKKVTGEHTGLVSVKSGSLKMNGKDLVGGEFVMDMTTINCTDLTDPKYNGDLVGHLKSPDFFDVANHPTSSLKIKSVSKLKGNTVKVVGDLTIKGITNEVTYNADVVDSAKTVNAKGKIIFDRTKYKIEYKSGKFVQNLGDKLIYDDVELNIEVVATK